MGGICFLIFYQLWQYFISTKYTCLFLLNFHLEHNITFHTYRQDNNFFDDERTKIIDRFYYFKCESFFVCCESFIFQFHTSITNKSNVHLWHDVEAILINNIPLNYLVMMVLKIVTFFEIKSQRSRLKLHEILPINYKICF